MSFDTTASRFLRPPDVARLRRNHRRVQLQRVLLFLRNAGLVATLAVIGVLVWRHVQSSRFAVQHIEISGAAHTPRAALDRVTQQYVGLNLFQIDIGRVQHDLGGLPWVNRIDIEKKLPDTLRIKIAERRPVALAREGEVLRYVDEKGVAFAELSPTVGDDDLPLVVDARGEELARTVTLLMALRKSDPHLYARISEVRPIPPRGFALFDRHLGAFIYANSDDISAKWRSLYAVLQAEQHAQIVYADLRFADRIVIKPARAEAIAAMSPLSSAPGPQPSALGPSPSAQQGATHVQN
ncbi:MAG TPA: FtsQ-type POTRA domain-containing protein [Thermoanaerobaculia bacterium]|jgi:cell division protein FtsQ